MKNATNIENTIIVAFLLLEYNIKVDERERMWSKVLIKNLKIDIIIVIKKKEVILLITENNNLEFKRELTDSIVKEIIAFCNTTGGTIILGYNDNGKVVGLKNAKEDLDRLSSKIDGMERIDEYEYPKNSLRELLCNTITHRDYEINGSNLIHIFNDKIEFLSLGGLVSGLTIEDIKLGSSSSRNPNLVNIFHRLNFVEAYGTGIPRMYEEYKASITSPEIKVAPNSFLVILPKLNLKNEYTLIIEYLKQNNQGTRENFETILKLGKSATINILNEMLEKEIIEKIGFSKNIVYKLK